MMVSGKMINKGIMKPVKEYIAEMFIGKKFHFKCECLMPLDAEGVVKGYKFSGDEIVLSVDVSGKLISIGLNHPKLKIKEIT